MIMLLIDLPNTANNATSSNYAIMLYKCSRMNTKTSKNVNQITLNLWTKHQRLMQWNSSWCLSWLIKYNSSFRFRPWPFYDETCSKPWQHSIHYLVDFEHDLDQHLLSYLQNNSLWELYYVINVFQFVQDASKPAVCFHPVCHSLQR